MTKFIRAVSIILFCSILSACGGGGGSAGQVGTKPLFTNAPTTLVMLVGESKTFQIGGGSLNFSAHSSSPNVVVSVKDRELTIRGVSPAANVSIEIVDSFSQRLTLTLSVVSPTATSMDITGASDKSVHFEIKGGTAPYTINVDDPKIAKVSLPLTTNSGAEVTASLLSQGSTAVSVVDARGMTTKIKLTVVGEIGQLQASLPN